MKQPPAFQFYASDYLSSSKVQRMSLDAEGAYIRLLAYSWQDGFIPSDINSLARLCKTTPRKMAQLWSEFLCDCFQPCSNEPTKLVNERLETVRRTLAEHKAERSQAGSKGAESRWQKNGSAIKEPLAKNGSPSPSPSPSPKKEEIQIHKLAFGKFKNVMLTDDECTSLQTKFGMTGSGDRIDALSEYIASKPTKYKSHYAVILMWERKNGAKHNGNMDKGERNAETARRLLSRLHSQDSSSMPRDPARSNAGGLSRASAEALFAADPDGHQPHD